MRISKHHLSSCDGSCDEGRECWRMKLVSQEEADRRGVKLWTTEDIEKLLCDGEAD